LETVEASKERLLSAQFSDTRLPGDDRADLAAVQDFAAYVNRSVAESQRYEPELWDAQETAEPVVPQPVPSNRCESSVKLESPPALRIEPDGKATLVCSVLVSSFEETHAVCNQKTKVFVGGASSLNSVVYL
jgi:hypothetical protein